MSLNASWFLTLTEAKQKIEAWRDDYNRGVQIDPSRSGVSIQLARAYGSNGLLDETEEQLKLAAPEGAAVLVSPHYQYQQMELDFYLELRLVQMERSRLEEAAKAFQKVLDRDPDHGPSPESR